MVATTARVTGALALVVVAAAFVGVGAAAWTDGAAAPTFVDSNVTEDMTWTADGGPYRVIKDISVAPGATLSIEPGTTVEFAEGTRLTVRGELLARGSPDTRVTITSAKQDPGRGAWEGLVVGNRSGSRLVLSNAVVAHAASGVTVAGNRGEATIEASTLRNNTNAVRTASRAPVTITGSRLVDNQRGIYTKTVANDLTVTDTTVAHNEDHGIYLNGGDIFRVSIDGATIRDNGGYGVLVDTEFSEGAERLVRDFDLVDSTVVDNGAGVQVFSARGDDITVSGTTIANNENERPGLRILIDFETVSTVAVRNNRVLDNGGPGIVLEGPDALVGAVFEGNTVAGNAGHGIKIHALGVIRELQVGSNRIARNGGKGLTVTVFESNEDDTTEVLVDSTVVDNTVWRNDGGGVTLGLKSEFWEGRLDRNEIRENVLTGNGGAGVRIAGTDDNDLHHGTATLVDNIIAANERGVVVEHYVNASLQNNDVAHNRLHGVLFADRTVGNTATGNDIYGNGFGMNVSDGAVVAAEENYWGAANGPFHASINSQGEGNPVNGKIETLDFVPFRNEPATAPNEAPAGSLSANRTEIRPGQAVAFSTDGVGDDGTVVGYEFAFGDGTTVNTSSGPVVHTYANPGTYEATLTVVDSYGRTAESSVSITVRAETTPTTTQSDAGSDGSSDDGEGESDDGTGESDGGAGDSDGDGDGGAGDSGDGNTPTASGGGPGFTVGTAVLAVLAGVLVCRWRRRPPGKL